MSSPNQPFTIPGYRLMRRLGTGGMATVWLAQQESLSRPVAIKVLTGDRAPSEELVRLFENEARTIARLDHPHIVQIHDVGRTSTGQIYYTMPHMPNGDLAARNLRDDPERVLAVVRAIAEALGYAHEHGIVHRDVKPENVLFDKQDRPLLADFGIALTGSHQPRVTHEGTTIGSSGYMSPEQARGQPIDGRSDLYSLGVLSYELLTGEMPFNGPDALAVALAHIEKPVPRLPATRRLWQPLIDKALAKDPEHRYQNAGEMIAAIDLVARRMRRLPVHGLMHRWRGFAARIAALPRERKALAAAGAALFALTLLALALPRTAEPPAPASTPPAVPAAAAADETPAQPASRDLFAVARERRLRDAAAAMDENRIANAADDYLAVLATDPHQGDAAAGIARILDRLATDAATAIVGDDAGAATDAIARALDIAARADTDAAPSRAAFAQTVRAAVEQRLARRRDAADRAPLLALKPLLPALARVDAAQAQTIGQQLESAAPAMAQKPASPPTRTTAPDAVPQDEGGPALAALPVADGAGARLAMAVDETTRGEYAAFARETRRAPAPCRASPSLIARLRLRERGIDWRNPGFAQDDTHPVVCVSWSDAVAYAAWLSRRTGARYRLPNSNEWLLAARQDGRRDGCAQANLASHASSCDDGVEHTAPAGRFGAGRSGVADIAGNVAEWVDVCAKPGREGDGCPVHRFRGLSWLDDDGDEANVDRMDTAAANVGFANVGIRVVRELP